MNYTLHQSDKFEYLEEGEGQPLILLHGLFGSLSNFDALIEGFKQTHRVLVPVLPLFTLPTREITVSNLAKHVQDFMAHKELSKAHVLGNSLGGHVGLVLTLAAPQLVHTLTLTGSSGLFEQGLGKTFPQRQNYEYMRENTANIFYDKSMATKELVDDVFELVNNRDKCLAIVVAAKSAMKHNLEHELGEIKVPTLLIWGKQDTITPPFVAEEFDAKIPNTTLHFIEECGHAPMMEKPVAFVQHLGVFLKQYGEG